MSSLVIWHDNGTGDHNHIGFTEYSMDKVHRMGGVDALLHTYNATGVYVESWDVVTVVD